MIRLVNIEKCYGKRCVLQGVNLTVQKGEFIAIMGRSGSGKSTLLNLIGGMDIPDLGMITVDGTGISSLTDDELTAYRREKIGFIFQFFNLLPNITVYENIEMPLLLNKMQYSEERVRTYINRMGLEGKEHDQPFELSGGEQQRVAIARALVHDPEIILADEPTGNLDTRTGASIMDLIRKVAQENNKTVILVTHDRSIAESADTILRIKDGQLYPWSS
jgi:putative ABC transport system ATP-binding protein